MAGIAAVGAYVPRYRLGSSTDGWGSRVERSVANFDEDSVTMAVAAGLDCLTGRNREDIDGLLFATTTPPYAEKGCASIIATALDLRRDIFTADITDVLRAGTTALKQALDSVAAGSARQVLVIASDNRQGAPKGEAERNSGDGAAAFIVSNENVIAELEGSYSISENMMDVWRSAGDQFVRSWEDRFAIEEGLERILGDAIAGFMERQGIAARDVARLALYAPDGRRHAQLARQLGFAAEQLQDAMFGRLGNTGAAFVPMLLASALADASPCQLIVAASYGDGSDVLGFRTTPSAGSSVSGKGRQRVPELRKVAGQLRDLRPLARRLGHRRRFAPPAGAVSVGVRAVAGGRPQRPVLRRNLQPVRLRAVSASAGVRQVSGPRRLDARAPQRPSGAGVHLLHGLPGGHHRHPAGRDRGRLRRRRPRAVHDDRPGAGRGPRGHAGADELPQTPRSQRHPQLLLEGSPAARCG